MRFINFLKNFFEESEEELKEEIIQAEEIIKIAKKKLKVLETKEIKKKKSIHKKWIFWLAIISVIIIIFPLIRNLEYLDNYFCLEKNTCRGCNVSISCIKIIEKDQQNGISLKVKNNYIQKGECDLTINRSGINYSKIGRVEIGTLKPNQKKKFKITMNMLEGKSDFSITPKCKYED